MKFLYKTIDQCLNRVNGVYKGYLSPKIPKQFTIPVIEEVGNDIGSLPSFIGQRLQRDIPGLSFSTPLIIFDKITRNIAGDQIVSDFKKIGIQTTPLTVSSNSFSEIERILDLGLKRFNCLEFDCEISAGRYDQKFGGVKCGEKRFDIIYGVGGGSVIDVAKYAAYKLNLPFVSIPTSLANDGFASPFAVLNLGLDGTMTLCANTPLAVVVDINLVKSDDPGYQRRIRSGIGDLLSNLTAVLDWQLADRKKMERYESYLGFQAVCGAKLVIKELQSGRDFFYDDHFLEVLACSLMASAEAMSRYGSSRPASGFEHKLYHAYNELTGFQSAATHGELVAVGALISSYAHDEYQESLRQTYATVGLPCDTAGLLACGIKRDILIAAIKAAERIKPDRYTILEDGGVENMLTAFNHSFPEH
ncbi:iron-containing alcohol dehydrogenase [Geopsychrobacter electrodiphilus]|uniref:iron-containing alcohol dehydrogenase n=1 Tax=Geopsychrobacter electrodiphilus TaxID=225196 RepID=UPI000365D4D8|nr:iron-containing alcohol dehydrogenase [Geopsychrobacter electrodiphilus]